MKGFIAVSCARDAPAERCRPDRAALACLADSGSQVDAVYSDDKGWIAFVGLEDEERSTGVSPDGPFTVSVGRMLCSLERDEPTPEVGALLSAGGNGLHRLLPPFAVVHRDVRGAPVRAAVDWLGFLQLYVWQGHGLAAVSTSARALARLAGAPLDAAAVAVQALVGWQVGDATIFDGVTVVPAATVATLAQGTVKLREYSAPLTFASSNTPPPSLDEAVSEMAAILRTGLEGHLAAHPEAVLQLTGGHDSRILLGAIVPSRRQGLHALTLGDRGSRDVAIADDLCRRYGMVHLVHPIDGQPWPGPAEVHGLVLASSRALECQASPLAMAPLLLAERHIFQGHRLSGLGGEVARGFYYGGQPRHAATSPKLIARLAQWRLCSNEAVEEAALDESFLAVAKETTAARLGSLFPEGDWLRATDEFYLYQRMRRWSGTHGTVATMHRPSVNMMFDRRFIELALAVAPADKRDSLLLGKLMSRLDGELASIRLDIGLVPARLGERTWQTRAAVASSGGRRAARKVWQRARRSRRPQAGAARAASLLLEHWRSSPEVCDPLFEQPFVRPSWLSGLLAAEHGAEPTTLAFLANVLAAATLGEAASNGEGKA